MKKSASNIFHFCSVLIAGIIILTLSSCAGFMQRTGSVTFTFDAKVLQNAARDGGDPMTEEKGFRIEVALEGEGGFGVKQTVIIPMDVFEESMETDRRFEAPFDNIPVGKKMYALVKVYRSTPNNDDVKEPFLIGKSNIFQVKAGNNSVELKAYQYSYYFLFNFEIKLDGFTNEEIKEGDYALLNGNLQFKVSYSNSKTAKKINSLGNDRFAIYDFIDEYTTAEYHEEIWDFYTDSSWEFNPDTKTISKQLGLSIPIDENTNGTKGKEIVFFAYNVSPMAFGVSKKIQPVKVKGEEIVTDVSFTVKKTLVSQVLYDYENDAYNYLINGLPNENFNGLSRGFCFDNDGYFYSFANDGSEAYELRTDNTLVNGVTLPTANMENEIGYYLWYGTDNPVITIDKTTNELYGTFRSNYNYGYNTLEFYKFPSLISSGDSSDVMFFRFSSSEIPMQNKEFVNGNAFVVNNGIVYTPIRDTETNNISLVIININNPLLATPMEPSSYPPYYFVESDRVSVKDIGLSAYNFFDPMVTDMYLDNNDLYLLIKDSYNDYGRRDYEDNVPAEQIHNIVSRGVIIKYNLSSGKTASLGWSNDSLIREQLGSNVKMYITQGNMKLYPDQSTANPIVVPITAKVTFGKNTNGLEQHYTKNAKNYFPSLYIPGVKNLNKELSTKEFYGPDKIVGILPKKLIIADDGIAVYVDEHNALNYKNVNRTICIDLEHFAIMEDEESINNHDISFSGDNEENINDWQEFDGNFWSENNLPETIYKNTVSSTFEDYNSPGSLYLSILNKD